MSATNALHGSGRPFAGESLAEQGSNLMAVGLVNQVQVTVFPVISGRTGTSRILGGAADFDLELLQSRTLDGHILELPYRPTLH